jgi:hypothetical protein
LFTPRGSAELAEKISWLWGRPEECAELGRTGREVARHEYSRDVYYVRLMAAYEQAVATAIHKR